MKVLMSISEYAKTRGLSDIAIRKQVSSNYIKSIKIDNSTYILTDDAVIKKLKLNITKKNSQIRELKLKLSLEDEKQNDKYVSLLEQSIEELKIKNESLQKSKDELYEKMFSTMINQQQSLLEK
jgi:uncharacterized protein with FMN-binding domain